MKEVFCSKESVHFSFPVITAVSPHHHKMKFHQTAGLRTNNQKMILMLTSMTSRD